MSRIEKGDFGQAASDLHTFAAQHPDDPRAEDAAFLEALSLSRAGRADDAAEAARRYLARYPNGYRRAEAEKLLAR
jgi:outer membrane protein assembly factor BamD (BamD/ComL family)